MYQIIWFPATGGTEVRSEAASLEGLDFDTVKDRTTWVVRVRGTSARKLADVDIADQPEKASEAPTDGRDTPGKRWRRGTVVPFIQFRPFVTAAPGQRLRESARIDLTSAVHSA